MSTQIIWTNHLKERSIERHINPQVVEQAIRFPDRVEESSTSSAKKHIKYVNGMKIVAAVKKEGNRWIVVSVWQNPARTNEGSKGYLLARIIYRFIRGIGKFVTPQPKS